MEDLRGLYRHGCRRVRRDVMGHHAPSAYQGVFTNGDGARMAAPKPIEAPRWITVAGSGARVQLVTEQRRLAR